MPVIVQFFGDVVGKEGVSARLENLNRDLVPNGQLWFAHVAIDSVTLLMQVRKMGTGPDWETLAPEVRVDGERFYRYRWGYRALELVNPNEDVPPLIAEAVGNMLRLDDAGPWVTWTDNVWRTLQPPRGSHEWVRAVKSVSALLTVKFVDNERGGWRISKAEDPPPAAPGAPADPRPVNRAAELREVLRAAGKLVE